MKNIKYVIAPEGCNPRFTPGKIYKVLQQVGAGGDLIDEDGIKVYVSFRNSVHLNGQDWVVPSQELFEMIKLRDSLGKAIEEVRAFRKEDERKYESEKAICKNCTYWGDRDGREYRYCSQWVHEDSCPFIRKTESNQTCMRFKKR